MEIGKHNHFLGSWLLVVDCVFVNKFMDDDLILISLHKNEVVSMD